MNSAVLLGALSLTFLAYQSPSVLWGDPGRVEVVDFTVAARGATLAPRPPFRFAGQPKMGASAKIEVTDALGRRWRVKSGPEARAESFVTRLISALGYFAEITWFVESGVVEGLPAVMNSRVVDARGRFTWAGFELMETDARFLQEGWTWSASPFAGSRELKGLKTLVMLVSNWDTRTRATRVAARMWE